MDSIIDNFKNPLLLADSVVQIFESEDTSQSLSALGPLYTLISKHNFEYPKFFCQLYRLLKAEIISEKNRPELLRWCDLFLRSTHISASIIASFVKILSKSTLQVPPESLSYILPMIENLLIRHPLIRKMINIKNFNQDEEYHDPFLENEPNPENSNALKSHLWELYLLQNHFMDDVAEQAKRICSKKFPRYEYNIEELIKQSINDTWKPPGRKFTLDSNVSIQNLL